MIDFFQTLSIKRFVFSDGDNVNNPKAFIDFLEKKKYLNLETQIVCFLGANQNQNTWYNTAIKYIQSLKKTSSFNVTPIRIRTEASNALDMVLTTYVGLSMAQNASSEFIIVSADKGYDSVVEHFSSLGISIRRESVRQERRSAQDTPGTVGASGAQEKNARETSADRERAESLSAVAAKLCAMKPAKLPKKESSLRNMIAASFRDIVQEINLDAFVRDLLALLKRKNKAGVSDGKIIWKQQ